MVMYYRSGATAKLFKEFNAECKEVLSGYISNPSKVVNPKTGRPCET